LPPRNGCLLALPRDTSAASPSKKGMATIDNGAVRQVLARYIALSEGRKSRTYRDTRGIETIGIGFNLTRRGARAEVTGVGANFDRVFQGADTLTDAQIDQLFAPDVDNAVAGARPVVSKFDEVNLARQIVMVDMVFNLGEAGFQNFRNAITAIGRSDFEAAANEMQDSAWFRQVGNRGPRNVLAMRTGALEAPFQQTLNGIE
jgi:GH24 family phage-related lysozyme (muramidase)